MDFSVLMSIYKNEKISNFKTAMESVLNQTLQPSEIILVRDGEVSKEMQDVINVYAENSIVNYLPLEKNQGLGKALAYGLRHAKNEIVARMDTDDICIPERFEIQIKYMEQYPEVDALGGQIIEFVNSPENPRGIRSVPTKPDEIVEYIKKRNPINHMTVVFRKSKVLEAGGYKDMYLVEDYYLWCRMVLKGSILANVPEVVVYARTGEDMFKRRGGFKYFLSWKAIEEFKVRNKMISRFQYIKTLSMRFILQVLTPSMVRGFVLEKFSRRPIKN